ncbi:MAG TPA: hypothetical protein VKI00_27825 [Mycobacterium sp.]|uniref:hypothetical protein n=1 Tax=Mycobacterium sp. TaxID=1785 RepID=UPI002C689B38|nr:hypothetical protein [Mycobacterium sp.]HME79329.1 hypothetical protein [Mycobacterium sp.]
MRKPTVLRIDGCDIYRTTTRGNDVVVIRLLYDAGAVDVPLLAHHAQALGMALTEM